MMTTVLRILRHTDLVAQTAVLLRLPATLRSTAGVPEGVRRPAGAFAEQDAPAATA